MAKSFTVIELDKHRNLRFGYKALMLLEDMMGCSLKDINFKSLTLKDISIILYCGLVHEDESLSIDKVIDLLDEQEDITLISNKIADAISNSFGDSVKK